MTMRVIIFKEGDVWLAQGLEHDICARGNSLAEVKVMFNLTVKAEQEERNGDLSDIEAAPEYFHKLWQDAEALGESDPEFPTRLAA